MKVKGITDGLTDGVWIQYWPGSCIRARDFTFAMPLSTQWCFNCTCQHLKGHSQLSDWGGVKIYLVASCYGNRDVKLRWMGHWHDADFTWYVTQACETVDFNAAIFIPHRFFQIHWVTCLWLTTCLLPLMLLCGCRCTTPTRGIRDLSRAIVPTTTWH